MDEQFEELLELLGFTDAEQDRMADEAFSDSQVICPEIIRPTDNFLTHPSTSFIINEV